MKYKKNKNAGFSLIELLIVVVIIAIVSSIATNTYQEQRSQLRYNDSVLKVLNLIKTARNYAITSHSVFDTSKPKGEEIYIPKEGYGVYLERSENPGESRIILFANTEADDEDGIEKFQYNDGQDLIQEEYRLDLKTNFVGLWKDQNQPPSSIGGAAENKAVIIFKPPMADAQLAVNDNPPPDNLTLLNDLYLEFKRTDAPEEIPSQYIHINKISGIAEMTK